MNQEFEILHDHYKQSFKYIREREKIRDHFFLWVVVFFGFLFLTVHYPQIVTDMVNEIKTGSLKINLSKAPVNILTSSIWAVFFIFSLRYCQVCITIERQYKYLHDLEEKVSGFFSRPDTYTREGRSYKKKYPKFTRWSWIFYTILFPLLVFVVSFSVLWVEFTYTAASFHLIFDTAMATGIAVSFVLYRGVQLWKKLTRVSKKGG